jgi:hypothetical protein
LNIIGVAGGEFFDVVEVGLLFIIYHHVEAREWLKQILFDTASPTPDAFDDIRT